MRYTANLNRHIHFLKTVNILLKNYYVNNNTEKDPKISTFSRVTLTRFGTHPAPFSSVGNWGRLLERAVLFCSCWPLTPAAPICFTPAWPYCWLNGAPVIPIYSEQAGERVLRKFAYCAFYCSRSAFYLCTVNVSVNDLGVTVQLTHQV